MTRPFKSIHYITTQEALDAYADEIILAEREACAALLVAEADNVEEVVINYPLALLALANAIRNRGKP